LQVDSFVVHRNGDLRILARAGHRKRGRSSDPNQPLWAAHRGDIYLKPGAAMNYTTDFKSIRDEVSAQEWQTRLDLAACYRLVDAYEMTDMASNHITARIPGSDDHLLINLYGMTYREITASSLVKIDLKAT
jgi:hypothetical protein